MHCNNTVLLLHRALKRAVLVLQLLQHLSMPGNVSALLRALTAQLVDVSNQSINVSFVLLTLLVSQPALCLRLQSISYVQHHVELRLHAEYIDGVS